MTYFELILYLNEISFRVSCELKKSFTPTPAVATVKHLYKINHLSLLITFIHVDKTKSL